MKRRYLLLVPTVALVWLAADIWQRSTFVAPRPTAIMTDRNGLFMAQLGGGSEGYGYWPVKTIPVRVAAAILALEDRRFWDHPGVDPIAVARALRSDLNAGRRVSGASTLAMQVARMQHPEARRPTAKFLEAVTALVMTARYGRLSVLRQYLLLVPFGQNSHGIEHAAIWYFARPASDLSWAQIAFLSAIPQAPGLYNPNSPSGLRRIKLRARLALDRLAAQNIIDPPDHAEALDDLQQLRPSPHPDRCDNALHAILLTQTLSNKAPPVEQIHSTIDLPLQQLVADVTSQRLESFELQGARQVAVILADRATMGVLALVGSGQYSSRNAGEIDYAVSWRSPGSTLKPFIFAQALDRATIQPDSIVQDTPDSGTSIDNADRRFLGPMPVPQALANSRNVPAAELVRLDGLESTERYLIRLGLNDRPAPASQYGLSLAIGGMPTDLDRLVAAYGALANQGDLRPLRWYAEQPMSGERQVMSANTARTITLFLADPMARLPSFNRMGSTEFPFPVAVKTGTSEDYRDAWVMEYTDKYVIGVWVGRPDDQPMDQVGGASSAALIGQDILERLNNSEMDGQNDSNFQAAVDTNPDEVCADIGIGRIRGCAQQLAEHIHGNDISRAIVTSPIVFSLRVVAPLDQSVYIPNPDTPSGLAVLPLRVAAGSEFAKIEWYVDGQPYKITNSTDTVLWQVETGRHRFQAGNLSGTYLSKPVSVTVQ